MNVLMLPDYRADNPYQELLRTALAQAGSEVAFPAGYRRVFPLWRAMRSAPAASLLHLHWTSPYLRHAGPVRGWIYSLKLLLDLALLRLSGCKVVWTLHNLLPHDHPHPRRERWLRRRICRLANSVIVHSENGRRDAIEQLHCPPERIVTIPHGHYRTIYGPPRDRSAARRQLGLPEQARVLLFFGQLRPYKGLERLLNAWRQVAASNTEYQLLIAGQFSSDAYRAKIESQIAGTPGVQLQAGRVADEQVATYFGAADCAVFPFERIQTSGSVLLAMSFGLPVLAPRLGDVPETLSGADDLLYDAGSEGDLQRQLQQALTCDLSDLRQRTTQACDQFGWDEIGRQTAAVYAHVLHGKQLQPV